MTSEAESLIDIDTPDVRCEFCGFHTSLAGQWSVEDGGLVFRADANPLPYRGPDLDGCSEGRESHTIVGATVDNGQRRLAEADFATLRATADTERQRWEAEHGV